MRASMKPSKTDQGARADATIFHVSYYRRSRAGWHRGSSLALVKDKVDTYKIFVVLGAVAVYLPLWDF